MSRTKKLSIELPVNLPEERERALRTVLERQGVVFGGPPLRSFGEQLQEHMQTVWGTGWVAKETWQQLCDEHAIPRNGSASLYAVISKHLAGTQPELVATREDSGVPQMPYNMPLPRKGLGMGFEKALPIPFIHDYGPLSRVVRPIGFVAVYELVHSGGYIYGLDKRALSRRSRLADLSREVIERSSQATPSDI